MVEMILRTHEHQSISKHLIRCMSPEELVHMKRLQLELLTGMVKRPGKVRNQSSSSRETDCSLFR